MASRLRIGLLVACAAQQNSLRHLVQNSGHSVSCSLLASEFSVRREMLERSEVDAWLVTLELDRDEYQPIENWLEHLQQPVIIDDGERSQPTSTDYQAWLRRVGEKLQQLPGLINLARYPARAARCIWVLAGSTGGPEAVREFFCALPAKLNIGFVYVQHMDVGFEQSLADIVNRYSDYPATPVKHGDVVQANGTAIIANDNCVELQANGTLAVKDDPWSGPYSPSVDQVFANVARVYGAHCGVITFSGMGDDGAVGARLVHQQGGQVWVQSPTTCAVDSMPQAVLATGVATCTASPIELALKLAYFIRHQ